MPPLICISARPEQGHGHRSEEEKEKIAKHKDFLLVRAEIENSEEWNQEQKQLSQRVFGEIHENNSDKKDLEKQLVQTQQEKEALLKLLSSDLKKQQTNLSNKEQNIPELHQQLIAQIQVITKN